MAMSPEDEKFQSCHASSTNPREMSPTALVCVALAGSKDILGKESHCQFEQIPLMLSHALKSLSSSAKEPLDAYIPAQFSRR